MSSSTKSQLVAVRMPLELLAEIDKSDQGRSVFIIGAVRALLAGGDAEAEKPKARAAEAETPRKKIPASPGLLEKLNRDKARASGLVHAETCQCGVCKLKTGH